jgi:ParB/RepB/Spo0J family partition protein
MTTIDIAPGQIRPSPFNHRTKFTGLDELGASLLTHGLIAPLIVRPLPDPLGEDVTKQYELVVGERRWRAAVKVKFPALPSIVRDLSDKEVIEIQLVENVQRIDVHPMDEAEGYRVLIDEHGYTPEQIAAKVNKSRTAIYNRLKLCTLVREARTAFLDDKFTASVAEMLARVPASLQARATAEILRGRTASKYELDSIGQENDEAEAPREAVEAPHEIAAPFSVREVQVLLQRRYMLRLELAPFNPDDATLVPEAGACTKCIHRTGNQPDLFADVSSEDVCTNPPCFEQKKSRDWERKREVAIAAGKEVLSPEESDRVFTYGRIAHGSKYVELGERADWQLQPEGGKEKTWAQLIGKDAKSLTVTLARDDAGAARELVDRDAAYALLREAGKLPKEAERPNGADTAKKNKERKRQYEIRKATAAAAIAEIAHGSWVDDLQALEWLAIGAIRGASPEAQAATCARRGIEVGGVTASVRKPLEKALAEYVGDLTHPGEYLGLVGELLAWESATSPHQPGWGSNLADAAKVWGLDMKKLQTKVTTEQKAKTKKGGAK